MVKEFKLTVVHFERPNPMQICACAWIYRWTKKLWKIRTGLLGWASGPRAAGLLLAKPQRKKELLIGFLLGDLFSYSHDQILFDDRLQYCVRGIRYLSHLGVKIYTVYKPALTHCIKILFKIQMSLYVIGFQQESIKGTEKASPIHTLLHR